jgi:hypothetical protein
VSEGAPRGWGGTQASNADSQPGATGQEEEQERTEPLLVFKDDFKRMPGLMPSNLKFKEETEALRPPQEKPSFPRENHKHKRLLGPGTAVLSSLMCAGYGLLAWLVRCPTIVCANTVVNSVTV